VCVAVLDEEEGTSYYMLDPVKRILTSSTSCQLSLLHANEHDLILLVVLFVCVALPLAFSPSPSQLLTVHHSIAHIIVLLSATPTPP
jgi:hypothetical protein